MILGYHCEPDRILGHGPLTEQFSGGRPGILRTGVDGPPKGPGAGHAYLSEFFQIDSD